MAAIASPIDEDRDRGTSLVAIYWAESAIAISIVSLRFYGRLMIRQLGSDDYMMLFTLVNYHFNPSKRCFIQRYD